MAQRIYKHTVELVAVADVDLLELEPVGFRHRRQVLQIACVGELVDHTHGILSVVDDVPDYCRPDESGSAGYDNAIHKKKIITTGSNLISNDERSPAGVCFEARLVNSRLKD